MERIFKYHSYCKSVIALTSYDYLYQSFQQGEIILLSERVLRLIFGCLFSGEQRGGWLRGWGRGWGANVRFR